MAARAARSRRRKGQDGEDEETRRAGRPAIDLDLSRLKALAGIHCTQEELAAAFGCSLRTIERRMETDKAFREAVETARADGRRSLRRVLFGLALKAADLKPPAGSLAALLFLCKQPEASGGLGMSDYPRGAAGGGRGAPEEPPDEGDDQTVRAELADKLERLAARAAPAKAAKKPRRAAAAQPQA